MTLGYVRGRKEMKFQEIPSLESKLMVPREYALSVASSCPDTHRQRARFHHPKLGRKPAADLPPGQ